MENKETSGQTDSFLTAARLLRGGWLDEDSTGRKQLPDARQPPSLSGRIQVLKDLRTGRVLVLTGRKPEETQTKTDEAKQADGGTDRRTDRRTSVVKVWTSGCRLTFGRSGRFKAPILPAIAEI